MSTIKNSQALGDPTKIKVLRYDRVVDNKDLRSKDRSCLHFEDFRRHLELLERWGYTTITFNDYRLFLKGELNLPRKPIVLTFDGEYVDNYRTVFPVLQKFGATGVIFVRCDRYIREDVANKAESSGTVIKGEIIVEMHAAGIEIGSQGMSQTRLTEMQLEKAREEITRSRILLEILLNGPVLSFCYPLGATNEVLNTVVAGAGYTIGCVHDSGPRKFGNDTFNVRRIKVGRDDRALSFFLRLLTA